MSGTPIAPVSDRDTIVADVEQLAKETHEFIVRGESTHGVSTEWVTLCTKLKRRLRQLQQFVDEVPPTLWDILFAGRDGGGLGGQMQPEVWREYEAQRHTFVLEQLANIKRAFARTQPPVQSSSSESTMATIWFHGQQNYSIDRTNKYKVSEQFDNILQAFFEYPYAMETEDLEDRSGVTNASRAMKELVTWNNGIFKAAIRIPGGKRKGGYFVRVQPP